MSIIPHPHRTWAWCTPVQHTTATWLWRVRLQADVRLFFRMMERTASWLTHGPPSCLMVTSQCRAEPGAIATSCFHSNMLFLHTWGERKNQLLVLVVVILYLQYININGDTIMCIKSVFVLSWQVKITLIFQTICNRTTTMMMTSRLYDVPWKDKHFNGCWSEDDSSV